MDRLVVFAVILTLGACDRENRSGMTKPPGPPKITTYEAHGVLREVSADRRKAVIAHETIPGYMEAMAMEFDVRDSELPNGLEPGDRVAFRLSVTETGSWIDRVHRIGDTIERKNTGPMIAKATAALAPIGT